MQQRFKKLTIGDKVITSNKLIEYELSICDFNWLLECEVDNVEIEIKDNILYWHNGIFYWGNWIWGIFNNGEFRSGTWNGGILYGGEFSGEWLNGKNMKEV